MDIVQNITEAAIGLDVKFTWHDYTLFMLMLGSSALIGIYFGCFGKKQTTADEYLLGGKEMNVFPIAMSLIASYISGITILAVPADVYRFGIQYWLICPCFITIALLAVFVFLPVFFKLQLISTYEYLKLRFNEKIRKIASSLNTVAMFLYLPIVIYVPALALAQATGFNLHLITPIVCGVCIFYTTIGGLKAVVWTDTLQFIVMIGAIAAVTYLGNAASGGFNKIWNTSVEGGRTQFDFDLDPTKRDSVWTISFGLLCSWINFVCISQGCVQKCLSLPSIKDVKKAFIIFVIGMIIINTISVYTGLMMYAKYNDCDPFTTNKVEQHDQLLPYYVIQVAGKVPGLPGLFIAGVFSAALSSLSACMNSLSGTIYEDFLSGHMPKDISQKTVSNILKWIVVVVGIICTGLVFVVEQMGSILPISMSFAGVTAGPLLGIFSMGMLVPRANSKGAMYGCFGSILIMGWIIMGSQYYKLNGLLSYPPLPVSTAACPLETLNTTLASRLISAEPEFLPLFIYRISHYYYTLMGTVLVYLIGVPISYMTNSDDPPVHKDLISPVMQWAVPCEKEVPPPDYYSVEKAIELMNNFN